MSIFESVTLTWQGKEYQVPPTRMLRVIAAIEEHVTLGEIVAFQATRSMRFAKVAAAYAAALRVAGATVADEEVYADLFQGGNAMGTYVATVERLLLLMVPPKSMQEGMKVAEGSKMGNSRPAAAKAQSKPHTKQRSGTGASARRTSGG